MDPSHNAHETTYFFLDLQVICTGVLDLKKRRETKHTTSGSTHAIKYQTTLFNMGNWYQIEF